METEHGQNNLNLAAKKPKDLNLMDAGTENSKEESKEKIKEKMLEKFYQIFGPDPIEGAAPQVFFSPGRVNLIGEHIDYNGGYVFPCALDLGIYGVMRRREDNLARLASGNFDLPVDFNIRSKQYDPKHNWANYPKGVALQFQQRGHEIQGFEMYVWGNLPNGAGLSSSASLTTLTAAALNSVFGLDVPPDVQAIMCQYAEHFSGVNCGVMDPFACAMGKKDHAILLHCGTLEYSYAPLDLGDYRILIANTNYRRSLTDSKYNARLAECKAALKELQTLVEINHICDLTPQMFETYKHAITHPVHLQRAQHAVYENYRTKAMAAALSKGAMEEVYGYMKDSHDSLRDLYEVTGDALDAMVAPMYDYAAQNPGRILGARMTGAGFGGCAVAIVHQDYINHIVAFVEESYTAKTGLTPSFYIAKVSPGAGRI